MGKYEEYVRKFEEDYEQPVVEDYIVGHSGLDPDKNVKPETINHEKLDGLIGGDWTGHYHVTQEQLSKFTGYQGQIASLEQTTTREITQARQEAKDAVNEARRESSIAVQTLESKTAREIGAISAEVHEKAEQASLQLTDISNRQARIDKEHAEMSAQYDEALSGLTEDGEVIDARVGYGGTRYDTLGGHLRCVECETTERIDSLGDYLQGQINESSLAGIQNAITLNREIEQRREGLSDVQRQLDEGKAHRELLGERTSDLYGNDYVQQVQIDDNAKASIRNALNIQREAETRREGINRASNQIDELRKDLTAEQASRESVDKAEALARETRDDVLQYQADQLGLSQIKSILLFLREHAARVKSEQTELQQRLEYDTGLQAQIDTLSNAILRSAATLSEAIERRKEALNQEILIRSENDDELQRQTDDNAKASIRNALNIQRESDVRREIISDVQRQLDARLEQCDYLQEQVNELISAVVKTNVNLHNAMEARRYALDRETQTRIAQDEALQRQIDTNAESNLRNSLNLHREAEQRRYGISQANRRLNAQEERLGIHETETAYLIGAVLKGAKNLHEALERRRKDMKAESRIRLEHDDSLQAQTDTIAQGLIQSELNAERRHTQRKWELQHEVLTRVEHDAGLQQQIDSLATSIVRGIRNLLESNEWRKNELSQEKQTRSEEDDALQAQIDNLANAIMRQAINDIEANRKITKDITEIKQKLDDIYQILIDTGTMTYRGARVATANEIGDMISDVMNGTDDGETSASEIPEDLKGDIATREEISEMLNDLGFTIPNRS